MVGLTSAAALVALVLTAGPLVEGTRTEGDVPTPMPTAAPSATATSTDTPPSMSMSTSPPTSTPRAICASDPATDTDTINDAILSSREGDTVVISGHCLVSGTITLLGGRSYRGGTRTPTSEANATIEQTPGSSVEALLATSTWVDDEDYVDDPITIRQLSLRGNGNVATSGIVLRSWRSVVEDVHVLGFGQDGIRLSNASANGTELTTSMVNGRIVGNFIEDSGRHGIYNADGGNQITDWLLVDNYIAGSGGDAIRLDNAAGWIVSRNHTYGTQGDGIHAARAFATTISDNYIEDFGDSAVAATSYGIFAELQGDSSGSTIISNRVFNRNVSTTEGSTYVFVGITGAYGTGAVAVTGNVMRARTPVAANTTGLQFTRGGADVVVATSTGNLLVDMGVDKDVGLGVTVTAGQ